MNRLYVVILSCLLTLPLLAEPADSVFVTLQNRIDSLMTDPMLERTQLGLYVYDLTADTALYKAGHRQRMRPASCEKILTASTALYYLGADYTLDTNIYVGDDKRVYLRGGMDPLLNADDIESLVRSLRDRGIRNIEDDIICDVTLKDTTRMGWGWCWDDPYAPLTPLLYKGKGTFEEAFRKELQNAHIRFSGNLTRGTVPQTLDPLCTISRSIVKVLQPMMKKSDNLCAECIYYHCGALYQKPYATERDAARLVQQFIDRCNLVIDDYQIADGSGLSLYNYVSPELLVEALRLIYNSENVFDTFKATLPVMGVDGTLRKRNRGTSAANQVFAKTGTVNGVSSLSGYAMAPDGHLLAFAIINQGVLTSDEGKAFQDRICLALTRPL